MRRFALAALSVVVASAQAQIVLRPSGSDAIELSPKTVDLSAVINGGVADSVWTYTFANAGRFRGQADVLIAIPKDGVVHGFAYWYQGEKVVARVAEKERAKRIYQAIVSRQRDPALIELIGKNTFRVRVFPVDAMADLKVELRIAQALPATPTGATLDVPLRFLGKLESATVQIRGDRKLQSSWGEIGPTVKYTIANSVAADLKVTEAWAVRALHASLRAARSGGPGGFFTLTLTPSRTLKHRRWRLEGDVTDVAEWTIPGGSVTLVGRYRKPGPVRAWLMGDGYKASTDVTMPDLVEANGPATKLWAWNRIGRATDRKEIVALSTRYTVPSKYTSWIAIPTEERKRMAREIAQADFSDTVRKAMPRLLRVGTASPKGKIILAILKRKAEALGLRPGWSFDRELYDTMQSLGYEWTMVAEKFGDRSPKARALFRQIEALRAIGVQDGYVENFYYNRATKLAAGVFADRLVGRRNDGAIARAAELRRVVPLATGSIYPKTSVQGFIEQAGAIQLGKVTDRVIQAEEKGLAASVERAYLAKLAQAVGRAPEDVLRRRRVDLASIRLSLIAMEEGNLWSAMEEDEVDESLLRKRADERRRQYAIVAANGGKPDRDPYASLLQRRAARFAHWVAQGRLPLEDMERTKTEIARFSEVSGIPARIDWPEAWNSAYHSARYELEYRRTDARREHATIARLEEGLRRVRPLISVNPDQMRYPIRRGEPSQRERDAYVAARHRGEAATKELQDLSKVAWDVHVDRLRVMTELDQLDRQIPDPQVLTRKQELEKKASELRARMGDPIVRIEAPEAKSVVAKMPDGTWLTLHRVPGTDRWEGRFDVPAGISDGRYTIVLYVDGARKAVVPINVDTAAPRVDVRWDGGRAEVVTDDDVKRVASFTPSGERVELVREAPGHFAALVPAGTRFVATDGAHNRSDFALGVDHAARPLSPGREGGSPWTNPGVVSSLAFVGDRLWVGTANDGGGFEGEARNTERPWVKAAVAFGIGLAVRYADGAIVVWDAQTTPSLAGKGSRLKLPRHSTCLSADGETLLVGTIGGFFEVRSGERRDIFPKELAGLVVTALLRDNERTWVGTQGRGLAEVWPDGKVVWHDERRGLRDDWITCLGRDAQGRIVAGTFVGGASVLDGEWRDVAGTEGTCVTGISGKWIATRQGVLRDGMRVSDEEATALAVHGDEVWIGTRQGPRRVR